MTDNDQNPVQIMFSIGRIGQKIQLSADKSSFDPGASTSPSSSRADIPFSTMRREPLLKHGETDHKMPRYD
jgi:hypothetical protein